MTAKYCVLFVALTACDGSTTDPMITLEPDAAVPVDAPAEPNLVTVRSFGEVPVFIAYRDGTGPWQTPKETSIGYSLEVRNAYELVAVCGDATTGYEVGFEAATFAEQATTFMPCFPPLVDELIVTARGTMIQAGSVAMGYATSTSATGNWAFQLDVAPGTHDLFAVGNDRIAIRRDLTISPSTTLAPVDVVTGGVAMPSVPLTVTGVQTTESVATTVGVLTPNEFVWLPEQPNTTAKVVPSDELGNDLQVIMFTAANGPTSRGAFIFYEPTSVTEFTLMPPLSGISFAGLSASWSAPLPEGTAGLDLFDVQGGKALRMSATPGFLGTRTTLAVPTDIPGFQPAWLPTSPEYRSFTVRSEKNDISLRTSVERNGALLPAPRARTLARLRDERLATMRRMRW